MIRAIFSLVGLCISFAFTCVSLAINIVAKVLKGLLFGLRHKKSSCVCKPVNQSCKNQNTNQSKIIDLNEERKKQKEKIKEKECQNHRRDWNIIIFLIFLIASISVLCLGKIIEASILFTVGLLFMALYSTVRATNNRIKVKKAEKEKPCKDEEVEKVLISTNKKLNTILSKKVNIKSQEMKVKLDTIYQSSQNIIKHIRKNPEDLRLVKKFFNYYVDAIDDILSKYIRIEGSGISTDEIKNLIIETEKSLDDIGEIFTGYEEKLLEKDILHLRAELDVIKNGK